MQGNSSDLQENKRHTRRKKVLKKDRVAIFGYCLVTAKTSGLAGGSKGFLENGESKMVSYNIFVAWPRDCFSI